MNRESEAERLLDLALEKPPAERDLFLAAACADEPDLHRELVALLPYADADGDFLHSPVLRPAIPDVLGFLEAQTGHGAARASGMPEQIGGYRIVRLLGYGGMGLIYEARQSDADRPVALKILYPWPATPELVRRFAYEARVLARLQSPGITKIFEVGLEEITDPAGAVYRLPFLVMELVEGERLDHYAARPDLSLADRLRLFVKICEAVHHAHQYGVIHRDLKPANILVQSDGQPKILDFGIARLLATKGETPPRLTVTGQVLGSLAYMSPEQLSGDPQRADVRSDVYALGVVLYEMLAGRLPFQVHHLSVADAALLIDGTKAPLLGSLNRALSGDLSTIVAKAMEKNPQHRYRSARELAADIECHLQGLPVLARSSPLLSRLPSLRRRALSGGALALLSLLAAGGVTVFLLFDQARKNAEIQRFAYRSSIDAAIGALEDRNPALAREALLAPPPAQRGWEWRHLWSRAQPHGLAVVAHHGPGLFAPGLVLEDTAVLSLGKERGYRFDIATGRLLGSWPLRGERMRRVDVPVAEAVHSPDGRFFAVWPAGGGLRLFRDGEPVCATAGSSPEGKKIGEERVVFGPAGSGLAAIVAADGRQLEMWDLASCRPGLRLAAGPEGGSWRQIGFGGRASWLVSDSLFSDQRSEVEIRDSLTGRGLRRIVHTSAATAVPALSPDGTRVVVGGADGRLQLFDTASGRLIWDVPAHRGPVTRLSFDAAGRRIASAGTDRLVRAWALDGRRELADLRTAGPVTALLFSRDGRRLLCSSDLLRNGGGPAAGKSPQDQALTFLDLEAPAEPWVLRGFPHGVQALAFDPAGRTLAAGGSAGEIVLWDPRSYEEIVRLHGHSAALQALAFSSDGARLVSVSSRETIVWDLATGAPARGRGGGLDPDRQRVSAFSHGTGGPVLTVSPLDRETSATADPGSTLGLWEVSASQQRGTFRGAFLGNTSEILAAAFSPDDRRLATGSRDGTVRLWDTKTQEQTAALRGHEREVEAVAFSPDGTSLASASADGTVRLWDTRTWNETRAERERQRRDRARAAALVTSLLHGTADLSAAIARLRQARVPDENLRREALREALRRSVGRRGAKSP